MLISSKNKCLDLVTVCRRRIAGSKTTITVLLLLLLCYSSTTTTNCVNVSATTFPFVKNEKIINSGERKIVQAALELQDKSA